MFPIVAVGSILSPLTNDVRIFYGIEELGIKYLSFPQNVYGGFWEIKPVGNHICEFLIALFTNIFVPFSNHALQEPIIKCVAVALVIFASWLFSKNILKVKYSFLLCFFGMFCALNLNILQAEFLAIIFAMISCALFVEKSNLWHYIAGALLIWVLLVKGTTGCLIVSAVCIVLIFNKHIDLIRGVIGFILMGLAFLAADIFVWPQIIPDILMAPILSHVGEYDWIGQIGVTGIATVISMSIYIPCIGIGIIYSGVWLKNHIRDPRAKWFVISFLAPLFVVFYQSESFAYQYYVFLLPAIVGIVLYEIDTPRERGITKKIKRENVVSASILVLFAMWCILYSPQPIWGLEQNYGVQELKMNNYFNENANAIEIKFNLSKENTLLYLDTGSAPYYFSTNSSCRYVAPLVIQRMNPNRTIVSTLPAYKEEYMCIMNYSNRYILADGPLGKADGWFGLDSIEKKNIVKRVNDEYTEVFSGAWSLYERKNESEILNLTRSIQ
ncbi:MAG: hypothetical protein WCX79_00780 [Candidatus Paceibacterota bacterium]|jgi:hypothetical protein